MIDSIYIEQSIAEHPRVLDILARFPKARRIECERYGQVFNPKAQNFRLQKQRPSLILARKHQNFISPAPSGYGIGAKHNYYFSHVLNCLYDCRYCFLQGMYQSAHYVLFVNYEDFQNEIIKTATQHAEPVHFFSGYDGDSLALEPVSRFAELFIPVFETLPNALLELRTKSTQVRNLLNREPLNNVVVAFSLSPDAIAKQVEAKAPSLKQRLNAIAKVQAHGWKVGLRFDPLIYQKNYQELYNEFFQQVFKVVDLKQLHSVSLGAFRLPDAFFKKIHKLYPEEKMLAVSFASENGMTQYPKTIEQAMMGYCSTQLLNYIPKEIFFPCH